MNLKSTFFIVLLVGVLFTLVCVSAAEDNQGCVRFGTDFSIFNG